MLARSLVLPLLIALLLAGCAKPEEPTPSPSTVMTAPPATTTPTAVGPSAATLASLTGDVGGSHPVPGGPLALALTYHNRGAESVVPAPLSGACRLPAAFTIRDVTSGVNWTACVDGDWPTVPAGQSYGIERPFTLTPAPSADTMLNVSALFGIRRADGTTQTFQAQPYEFTYRVPGGAAATAPTIEITVGPAGSNGARTFTAHVTNPGDVAVRLVDHVDLGCGSAAWFHVQSNVPTTEGPYGPYWETCLEIGTLLEGGAWTEASWAWSPTMERVGGSGAAVPGDYGVAVSVAFQRADAAPIERADANVNFEHA